DGASVNSPVHVHATYSATAKYMKLWVDHVASTVQLGTSTFDSFVSLSNGIHLIEVQAQDASTLQIFTSAANITVATLAVNPSSTSLPPGGTQQFTATDSASSSISWSATGGTITNNGFYTAGSTTGNFTVTAKDSAGNTTTASMVIAPAHTVSIESPANGSTQSSPVLVRATYASTVLAAYMKVWVDHNPGLTIHNTNTFVTSQYLADGSHLIQVQAKDATTGTVFTTGTNITVNGGSGPGITVSPSSVTLSPGATQQFTAADKAGLAVTWSATGGTITSTGLYTAGSTAGTFTVTALDGDANKGTATVTISGSGGGGLNYVTWKNDNFRTGQQLKETVLAPSNVNSTHFGIKFSKSVDGYVFAQPLYLSKTSFDGTHNAVFVATEHDSVYAFDADVGTQLWHKGLIPSGGTTVPQANVGSTIYPEIGITGTPVIDATAGTIYLVTETLESGAYIFRLHALSVTTGNEKPGSPVKIQPSGFQAKEQLQRPGLLLANGNVYVAFGSQGDNTPYHGWIVAFHNMVQTAVWNSTATGSGGAIWMGGSGIAADSSGNLYVMTGNGFSSTDYNGSTNWSQSFVKLSPTLTVLDHFTPFNWLSLQSTDSDLGSGGPLLIPTQSTNFPHELVGCGKPPNPKNPGGTAIWILNRDHMGGLESAPNNGQAIQELGPVVGGGSNGLQPMDHCFMTPAFWQQNLYFIGNNDVLKQFVLSSTTGKMSTSPTAKGSFEFFFPGAQPVVSANGSSNGIVWAISYSKTNTQLVAHAASNVGTRLFVSGSLGPGAKFAVPTVINGKVYVGTGCTITGSTGCPSNGQAHLYVFGSM
ncbi:MAG TPA: Ig-like domain-containing protein, partial [Terriglobales bacterium]|nr:Ig-like domain-containing protein [Terriglobales bacterium]